MGNYIWALEAQKNQYKRGDRLWFERIKVLLDEIDKKTKHEDRQSKRLVYKDDYDAILKLRVANKRLKAWHEQEIDKIKRKK